MARKSAEARRKRAGGAESDEALIVQALTRKAKAGDVAAARELREWSDRAPTTGANLADLLSLLTPEQQRTLQDWLEDAQLPA